MIEWFNNLPKMTQRFIAGVLAGLSFSALIVFALAPLVLALMLESWGWMLAYVIVIPVISGIFAVFDIL